MGLLMAVRLHYQTHYFKRMQKYLHSELLTVPKVANASYFLLLSLVFLLLLPQSAVRTTFSLHWSVCVLHISLLLPFHLLSFPIAPLCLCSLRSAVPGLGHSPLCGLCRYLLLQSWYCWASSPHSFLCSLSPCALPFSGFFMYFLFLNAADVTSKINGNTSISVENLCMFHCIIQSVLHMYREHAYESQCENRPLCSSLEKSLTKNPWWIRIPREIDILLYTSSGQSGAHGPNSA